MYCYQYEINHLSWFTKVSWMQWNSGKTTWCQQFKKLKIEYYSRNYYKLYCSL